MEVFVNGKQNSCPRVFSPEDLGGKRGEVSPLFPPQVFWGENPWTRVSPLFPPKSSGEKTLGQEFCLLLRLIKVNGQIRHQTFWPTLNKAFLDDMESGFNLYRRTRSLFLCPASIDQGTCCFEIDCNFWRVSDWAFIFRKCFLIGKTFV